MGFPMVVSPNMGSKATLDNAGRILIPKTLRHELHLEPGDTVELEPEGESVRLRPVRFATPLRKERGVWVFHSSKKLPSSVTEKVLREVREERDRRNVRDEE